MKKNTVAAHWLSPDELREFAALRNPDRQTTYLAGRRLAKQLLARQWKHFTWRDCSIRSRDQFGRHVRPQVWYRGRIRNVRLSLTHTDAWVGAALTLAADPGVGIDVTTIRPQSQGFLLSWFSERERCEFDLQDAAELAVCWCAKEAAYKAADLEMGFAPNHFQVSRDNASVMGNYQVTYNGRQIAVKTRRIADQIIALAVAKPTQFPDRRIERC